MNYTANNIVKLFIDAIGQDAFRDFYVEEGDGFEDDPDAYEADNIFFVPPEARWSEIAKAAPHTGNRHNLRQSHDSHRSRQQKPQRRPSKKLRQPRTGQTRSW